MSVTVKKQVVIKDSLSIDMLNLYSTKHFDYNLSGNENFVQIFFEVEKQTKERFKMFYTMSLISYVFSLYIFSQIFLIPNLDTFAVFMYGLTSFVLAVLGWTLHVMKNLIVSYSWTNYIRFLTNMMERETIIKTLCGEFESLRPSSCFTLEETKSIIEGSVDIVQETVDILSKISVKENSK